MSYLVEFLLPHNDDWADEYTDFNEGNRVISVPVDAVPRTGDDIEFTIEGLNEEESPCYTVSRVGHLITKHVELEDVHQIVVTLR